MHILISLIMFPLIVQNFRVQIELFGYFNCAPVEFKPFVTFMFYLAKIWIDLDCIYWKLSFIRGQD